MKTNVILSFSLLLVLVVVVSLLSGWPLFWVYEVDKSSVFIIYSCGHVTCCAHLQHVMFLANVFLLYTYMHLFFLLIRPISDYRAW